MTPGVAVRRTYVVIMKRFFALSMIAGLSSASCHRDAARAQGPGGTIGGETSDLTGTDNDVPNHSGGLAGETTHSAVNPPGSAAPAHS